MGSETAVGRTGGRKKGTLRSNTGIEDAGCVSDQAENHVFWRNFARFLNQEIRRVVAEILCHDNARLARLASVRIWLGPTRLMVEGGAADSKNESGKAQPL